MPKDRLKSPRARLFVALDLPDDVVEGLRRWQRRQLTDPALRPMAADQLHITLAFLAYHPVKKIERIAEIVTGVDPKPIPMRFEREASPVPKGRPRLYALNADSRAAIELQAELSDALEAARLYTPEKRAFWPHVTVARVRSERLPPKKGERKGKGRPRRVATPPGPLPAALTERTFAVRLRLYRSNLKPTGAEYEALAGLDLPPAPGVDAKKR
ncbi:MAG TPA: RNA 2',3'-cyclic phosphodiesterase [Solirubrobacterales bacterium]|nr:RNA 2',3'-cyclic phosphodiesterase [Solirubrobacterales bacterium]